MTQSTRYDTGLLLIALILLGCGLVMVFSTSSVVSGDSYVFLKHLVIMTFGIAVMAGAMKLDYHYYAKPWVLGVLVVLAATLLVWALLSPPINNVHRWIVVGPFRAQPSEFAKLVMVLFTASFVIARKEILNKPKEFLLPFFFILPFFTFLFILILFVALVISLGFVIFVWIVFGFLFCGLF